MKELSCLQLFEIHEKAWHYTSTIKSSICVKTKTRLTIDTIVPEFLKLAVWAHLVVSNGASYFK